MSHTVLEPESTSKNSSSGRWMVMMFNNDVNTIDEVIEVLCRATQCGLDEAEIETWEAHTYGKAPVHFASQDECTSVAEVISAIGVRTEVEREWTD